jgi:hypothetical protein
MLGSVADTRPFAPFEWLLALRYLRARRKEGFISVIAGFSFLGILLGVATLIIVMSVMNGFRKELFNKILGLNGHVIVGKAGVGFDDYAEVAQKIGGHGRRQARPAADRGPGHGIDAGASAGGRRARGDGGRHQGLAPDCR